MVAPRVLVLALPLVAVLHATARADDDPPPVRRGPVPQYPTPLAPETQSTDGPPSWALWGQQKITSGAGSGPVRDGYTPVERAHKHLIVGGAVTFGVSYGLSAF